MFTGDPLTSKIPQPPYDDASMCQKVKDKIQRVMDRVYIVLRDIEEIESLMFFFHVPKGEDDIIMVYDGTKSSLNKRLYAPWFALPTNDTIA